MTSATLKRDNEFKRELGKFLRNWDTEIELEYTGNDYCQDRVTVCYLHGKWENDEQITSYSRIELGTYITKTLGL